MISVLRLRGCGQMDYGSHQLLTSLLRDVSRSFYLTLRILPSGIRQQIGLAYLLARTTDTIADTELLPLELNGLSPFNYCVSAFSARAPHHQISQSSRAGRGRPPNVRCSKNAKSA